VPSYFLGQISIDFAAKICRSVLKVDVHELVFDDCLIGMSYVKDFTIWNRSEMPLVFYLSAKQEPALEFTDFETGLPGNCQYCHLKPA